MRCDNNERKERRSLGTSERKGLVCERERESCMKDKFRKARVYYDGFQKPVFVVTLQ